MITFTFIFSINCVFADSGNIPSPATTYNRAQVTEWLNDNIFVVGRWDGSISVFREPEKEGEYGPVILQALIAPSSRGIEMLQRIDDKTLISSNDDKSMVVWKIDKGILVKNKVIDYSQDLGVINSGISLELNKKTWVVAGHASGSISIWYYEEGNLLFKKSVNVRSDMPPANPFNIYNIRSIVHYKDDIVILASEDGDVTFFQVTSGKVLSRTRYNKNAKRGINSAYYNGEYLVLANCSVGNKDKNLWLYRIDNNKISLVNSINLIKDTSRDQVFNFDVEMITKNNKLYFYASTEEGLLWVGHITNDQIKVVGNVKVSLEGGASLDIDPDNNSIIVVSHAIKLFPLLR